MNSDEFLEGLPTVSVESLKKKEYIGNGEIGKVCLYELTKKYEDPRQVAVKAVKMNEANSKA